ncbi:hypothetical protein LINPERHAP1_LOCUS29103 [Linum perenne]
MQRTYSRPSSMAGWSGKNTTTKNSKQSTPAPTTTSSGTWSTVS